jgi:3-hydroxymyristoyl/3-hydroxydecanoyl-(acyl carrier protein) dehydratase
MSLDNYILQRIAEVEKGPDRVKFSLCIPNDLPHLQGHFPGQPITPSIVLIEISALLIQKSFELESREYKSLKKSRVSRMILPEVETIVEISRSAENTYQVLWLSQDDQQCAKFIIDF